MDVGALQQLAEVINKGGVVGVLLIACAVLVWEVKRGRRHLHDAANKLATVYAQRDRALLCVVKLKTICEQKGIPVDLRDVNDLLPAVVPSPE